MTKIIERPGIALPPLPDIDDVTRRELLIGAAGLLVLAPYGCGGDDRGRASGERRTVEHKYGATEIQGTPEQVLTVGYGDHDAVLALGFEPVGVGAFIGDRAIWPWNEDDLGDATPEELPVEELDFEKIATLDPDLITAVFSGITEQDYERLSQIAPTVAQSGEYADFAAPWQETTRMIGRALGKEELARKLVAEAEAQFAEVRRQHPEFEGSTLALATLSPDGTYFLYGQDAGVRVLTSLGFEFPAEIAELVGDTPGATVSRERLDLVDADVLLWQLDECCAV